MSNVLEPSRAALMLAREMNVVFSTIAAVYGAEMPRVIADVESGTFDEARRLVIDIEHLQSVADGIHGDLGEVISLVSGVLALDAALEACDPVAIAQRATADAALAARLLLHELPGGGR